MSIKQNLQRVQERIIRAAYQYHRSSDSIQLLAVSKTKSVAQLTEAYDSGQRLFGENYLQEAIPKIQALRDKKDIEFHFIGDIQSNKTKLIAENFIWVHSVDRRKIAKRLNDQRPVHLPPLNICIEVNVSRELSKSGVANFKSLCDLAQFIQNTCPRLVSGRKSV
jgi:pyridoxal phosphate enzyme (YggS family)